MWEDKSMNKRIHAMSADNLSHKELSNNACSLQTSVFDVIVTTFGCYAFS